VGVVGRAVILRQRLVVTERVTWPMIGLTSLALASVIGQPYDNETWSLLASKLIVPLALFHLAGLVFTDERRFRHSHNKKSEHYAVNFIELHVRVPEQHRGERRYEQQRRHCHQHLQWTKKQFSGPH
jgi:hypothetical protein